MSYTREHDDLPWEARRGVAKVFLFYPKSTGLNVAVEDAPAPTFTVHDPSGTTIQSGTGFVFTSGTPAISSIQVPVSAIATLGERYSVRVSWQVDGATNFELYVRMFDVVLNPFDQPLISSNEMIEDRPEVEQELDAYGVLLGYATGSDAITNAAAMLSSRARLKLISWIRAGINADSGTAVSNSQAPRTTSRWYGTRPALIVNRDSLGLVERELALEALYNAIADNPLDGEQKNDKRAQFHRREAQDAWARVKLEYDSAEDLVPDTQIEGGNLVTYLRRVQA